MNSLHSQLSTFNFQLSTFNSQFRMYLAPLNYDRFFKKVFSHVHIAKAFLEDFLGVEIEEIKPLERAKYLTDESAKIEVDFRCKIKGSYIIIEMQQWYKPDVVRRFYLYHCASTTLQLETLAEKKIEIKNKNKKAKDRNYKEVQPVLTLVWMVNDNLEFTAPFVAYTTAPETALTFLENHSLWEKEDIKELLELRKEILKTLENKHKNLDFLRKNRLIFMFQDNIAKDDKLKKYRDWFEFAEKTLNKANKKADFHKFQQKDIFKEIMSLIAKSGLDKEELAYISDEAENIILFKRFIDGERETIFEEVYEEIYEEAWEKGIEKGIEKGREKERILQEELREKERRIQEEKQKAEKINMAKTLLMNGVSKEIVQQTTQLSIAEIEELIKK